MLTVVHDAQEANDKTTGRRSLLDEIVRDGARQMLAVALKAEVAAYVEQFADQLDENGRRLVVRNGYHQAREVLTAAGAVEVKAPRVNDRRVDPDTGERQRFSSAVLPAWARKSPQMSAAAALPKSAHPAALAAIKDIYNAEDIDKAQVAVKAFEVDFGAKYPKAVAKIVDDLDTLLEFYKYPAEHWIPLRTTNPIESTFATMRLQYAMAYKLIDAAQARWRAVNAPHLVALVRAGAVFHKGKLLERPTDIAPPQPPSDGAQQAGTEVA